MISKKETDRNHIIDSREPLAIIGMGCRMPGGVSDPESFWDLMTDRRSGIVEVPENRWNKDRYYHENVDIPGKMITKWGGFVDNLENFDAQFFGISPREALRMDPQQRWLLEVSWEALEDAGKQPEKLRGEDIGVFVGIASNDYANVQMRSWDDVDVHTNSGSTLSIASNRIAYLLDFKGPAVSVDTACSSALVAVNLACHAIWSKQCDSALAGGVNALVTPDASIGFSKASMLSPSGQCFAFDARANGYVRGEGAGMVYIKPLSAALEDNDPIYATIRAAVVNQDGNTSSMTVPGVEGQSAMLRRAYDEAGIPAKRVVYMEAHGTGTPVGDPIETVALGNVLSEGREEGDDCLIGSIKTNIGHLESGSGVAGLIKAALVLHKDTVPPNLNFEEPNPNIPFEKLHLKVADETQPLPHQGDLPPVTAVNSFGFGGTNAHIVLEAPPAQARRTRDTSKDAERPYLLPISARDETALENYAKAYHDLLEDESLPLAEICYTAGNHKDHHDSRLTVFGKTHAEIRGRLKRWLRNHEFNEGIATGKPGADTDEIVFVFTGQGAQWWAMGQELLEREPVFRDTIEKIDRLLKPLAGWSLLEEMTKPSNEESNINNTNIAQPAIFALQVALAELWKSWGIKPSKVIGHSVGEVAAAYAAGAYSLEDAVTIIYHRSRLQDTTGGKGRMVAVGISPAEARHAIHGQDDKVQLAVINSPSMVTLAGDTKPLEAIVAKLEEEGKFVRWLRIDYAFHTHQMEPIKDELLNVLADIKPLATKVPFISTVTGGMVPGEKLDGQYWWRNVREAVLFGPAMSNLIRTNDNIFLELGPHPALQSPINECLSEQGKKGAVFHSLKRKADETNELFRNLSALHIHGIEVDWAAMNQSAGNLVRLPHYPWNRERYWLENEESVRYRLADTVHPFLGLPVTAPNPTWEFALDPRFFKYIEDHQIWDSIVMPAAGYGEIGLALAAELFPDEDYAVEDLEMKQALFVSESKVPMIQVVFDETTKAFFIYSGTGDRKTWDLNAQGRLTKIPPPEIPDADFEKIKKGLPDYYDHEKYYDEYLEAGYQFGPNFQHLHQVWRRQDESFAEIVVPEEVLETAGDYHIHPAVLDAFFHTVRGSIVTADDALPSDNFYLPASVHRIRLLRDKMPERMWGHCLLHVNNDECCIADIFVYDDDGKPVAEVLGFRADRVEQKDPNDDIDQTLYQFKWELGRLHGTGTDSSCEFADTKTIAKAIKDATPGFEEEFDLLNYYDNFAPRLDLYTLENIIHAYRKLGWKLETGDSFTFDNLTKDLGIIRQHHRLVRAHLHFLEQEGWLKSSGDDKWDILALPEPGDPLAAMRNLAEEYPDFASEAELELCAAPFLAEVLSGEEDPVELLFPGGSSKPLEKFYTEGADFQAYNKLIETGIAKAIENLPQRRALRILEVGAGTGSLTRAVLPILPPYRTEYTFTDIGPAFLQEAKKNFTDYPFVEYTTFDIEKDPAEQGVDPHSFDLILATNVIHATRDLKKTLANVKRCLAPDGLFTFVEVTDRLVRNDAVFGLLKGWWMYEDRDLRQESALLKRDQWKKLLDECGFEQIDGLGSTVDPGIAGQTIVIARGPESIETEEKESPAASDGDEAAEVEDITRTHIVFADEGKVAAKLIKRLQDDGDTIITVTPGDTFGESGKNGYTVNLENGNADLKELLALPAISKAENLGYIIHCWSLDHPVASDDLPPQAFSDAQRTGVLSAFHLVQALAASEFTKTPKVCYVTRGVKPVLEDDACDRLASAPTTGVARVTNNEHAEFNTIQIDLDPNDCEFEIEDLYQEFRRPDGEFEIAHRGGRRYVNRLHQVKPENLPKLTRNAVQKDGSITPYRLQIDKPGILTNLSLNETSRRDPDPDEIEVEVKAGGINFRDVMKALGMYPGNPIDVKWFGDDFSGTVVKVGKNVKDIKAGDNVCGMAPYCFRAFVTVNRHMVFKKPDHISFEEAATLPTVFLTSHYALNHLAHMQKGERILIHAGTGGVGQAAIQIAKGLGLEIFSTAGTPEKRQMLKDMGVHHVMNSRTLEFADEIMEITEGKGVDAVLNSLAGDFIPKNFSVLAPFGRFLEIGKIDIYGNSKIGLEPLRNNISYFVIDLAQHLEHKPEFVASMFAELAEKFFAGDFEALPHKVFPINDVVEAFRYMAQGKHVGKNVLSFQVDEIEIGPCTESEHLFRKDATYLITGGAGGFGLQLAKWMAKNGAGTLALMSRGGPREEGALETIKDIKALGAEVVDARGDVTSQEDVVKVIEDLKAECAPLRGVIHGAMVLDDEFMAELDEERFSRVVDPKMLGGWNLHTATLDLDLEHFICFSSLSSVIGNTKQANYNSGNYFLDMLAHYRRAKGLPALTINWGALGGAGFVERNEKTLQYLDKLGMKAYTMEESTRVLQRMLPVDAVRIAASYVDWSSTGRLSPLVAKSKTYAPVASAKKDGDAGGSVKPLILGAPPEERQGMLEDFIAAQVAGVFGTDVAKIDRDTPLTNLGLDSLMAIELMNRIEGELGMQIPMGAVLNGPNIKELAVPVLQLLLDSSDPASVEGGGAAAGGSGALVSLEKLPGDVTEFPLTEGQSALWFLHRLAPESSAYNLIFSCKFRPLVDIDVMEQAFRSLFDRHPMLDVTFHTVDGKPVQRIHRGRGIDFREHDASKMSDEEIKKMLIETANKPFDLENGPVIRLEMVRTHDDAHVALLCMHHTVSDAWSMTNIVNDLIESYFSLKSGRQPQYKPMEFGYADFVDWEHRHLESEAGERAKTFWHEQLDGAPMVLDLPTDRPRPPVQSFNGATHPLKLDEELTQKVTALAGEQSATLFTMLLSAFDILLHRYCNQEDLLVGVPLAGRNQPELHGLVGYFINPVVMRSRIDDDPSFIDYLLRNSKQTADAIENQQYPISRLVDDLNVPRDPSRSPMFQVSFSMERIPGLDEQGVAAFLIGQAGHEFHVGDMSVETIDLTLRQAQFEITLVVEEAGGNIYGCWQYNRDLFAPETIAYLNELYTQVLREVTRNPAQKISEINLLPQEEEARILDTWNSTQAEYSKNKLLHELVADRTKKSPDAIAVRCGGDSLTFAELDARANGLALELRSNGIGPDTPVGLFVDRSVDMIVGTLGILKAGGCYIPMDPEFPGARLELMLENANPSVIVTEKHLVDRLPNGDWQVIDIAGVETVETAPVVGDLTPHSLAYIIYTSGSTGTPKGVEISHRAAVNFLSSMAKEPGLTDSDRLLAVTTLSFDISLLEIYLPLLTGAQCVIATRDEVKDGRRLDALLNKFDISVMQATPATWNLLLEAGWEGKSDLRILCGGEALPRDLANSLVNSAKEVWNLYGPTETTVWSTCERLYQGNDTVSIGRPIANTSIYVLDESLLPVPVGFVGDLYIGGHGLARGYHDRPDLTAEQFITVKLPNGNQERLYKTGDLARWTPEGKLECLGRSDFQIKLRGVRMELEDIESQLSEHEKVKQVVVVKRDDLPGGPNLVAYVIADGETGDLVPELRGHLVDRLPESMRPAFYVFLEEFPLTPNKKIDRMRLPTPRIDRSSLESEFIAPQTPNEKLLAEVFCQAFEIDEIGIRDNFFEMGGDSLLAVRILAEVSQAFNRDVPVEAFLRYPTIEQLARYLYLPPADAESATAADSLLATDISDADYLTFAVSGTGDDLPKVDAVALTYIPDTFAAVTGLSKETITRDWFDNKPIVSNVYELPQGNIGVIMLPLFELDLYKNEEITRQPIVDALSLAGEMGAKTVALTGVIPSATDHGRTIEQWTAGREDLPAITTGDATRTATIVKSIEGVLEETGRDFAKEKVAFVGLGSIGKATVHLALETLPRPKEIILCDPYQKPEELEAIRDEILATGYDGEINIVVNGGGIPPEFYEASFIIGATSLPGALDIKKLHPGAMIVDYSFPPVFRVTDAIRRLDESGDILFTTGGQLRFDETIPETIFLPEGLDDALGDLDARHLLAIAGRDGSEITGCVLVSLLTGMDKTVKTTIGPVENADVLAHYKYLDKLGAKGGRLQMENYFIKPDQIKEFKSVTKPTTKKKTASKSK
ncbi:MAG: amino acid adenylation domain-containing protein [Verrucomicrobiota bacterium]